MYRGINGATIITNNYAVQGIVGETGSTFNLGASDVLGAGIYLTTGATLVGQGAHIVNSGLSGRTTAGVYLSQGAQAVLTNSVIQSTVGNGVDVRYDSQMTLTGSQVTGLTGALVSTGATLNLIQSTITGTGGNSTPVLDSGMFLSDGGTVNMSQGSTITGTNSGVLIGFGGSSDLVVDNSTIAATAGSGILIGGLPGLTGSANILLRNGSVLSGSNGVALEVEFGSSATLGVDGSTLEGGLSADGASQLTATLAQSVMTGDVTTTAGSRTDLTAVNSQLTGNVSTTGGSTLLLGLSGSSLTGDITASDASQVAINLAGAVVNGNVSADATSVATLQLEGSQLTGNVTNVGTVDVRNASVLTGNITGSDTVQLTGAQVDGDLTQVTSVSLTGGSVLNGNIAGSDTLELEASSLTGDVTNSGSVALSNGSVLTGTISGSGTVQLSGSQVNGNLTQVNSVSLTGGSVLNGDIAGSDTLQLDASSLTGDVTNTGSVALSNGSVLTGNISGSGAVQLTGSQVNGDLTQVSSVALAGGSVLNGDNTGSAAVQLDDSAMTGNVTQSGSVVLSSGSVLTGNVNGSDTVQLTGSQVNGNLTQVGSVALVGSSALNGDITGGGAVQLVASSMTGNVITTDSVALSEGSLLTGNVADSASVQLDGAQLKGDVTGMTDLSLANSSLMTGNFTVTGGTGTAQLTDSTWAGDAAAVGGGVLHTLLTGSELDGDVSADSGSEVTVALSGNSLLVGALTNVASVTLSESSWSVTGDSSVGAMTLDDSTVTLGAPGQFYRLALGSLEGNGTFKMNVDFARELGSFLDVSGTASGQYALLVSASGEDPSKDSSLQVVHTGAGSTAQFSLLGGPVDVGTYSYDLIQRGTNWYLDSDTKTISPGTRSVLALFNTAPTVWYGELSTLRSRMGELRYNDGAAGGWMRAYGNQYNVSTSSGVGYQQNQHGLTFGADGRLPVGDGHWLAGLMGGYSDSTLALNGGTSGNVDSYYVGAYTTWLNPDSGYYFDGVLKFNRFQNSSRVSMSDGTRSKGNYTNNGVGTSLEFGRHIKLQDGYFVEPYAQLAGVTIGGRDYRLNNGMQADGDATRSLLGKVGSTVGRTLELGNGTSLQPYLRAALAHEFVNNNRVQINDTTFNNDLSGSRGELGAGVSLAMSERLQLHVDLEYSNGTHIEQPWGANVGLRFAW
ncbi:autotransporter outer membrane beta-barrel domain-containing protein [Pseudomonas eucalypticola]|uniref:mannuronan 5-epimerase n=1 Tax=Pseudomonas eucalypticola TaxID=2599595 RepID=A0A7D5D7C8_9PSED|nr:autotransporter outer membrane beta-barrel domain-containing protein [Pseudomonas eucalypticola]QKZ04576.1 autotransporter outer membrane beta-barrel domain-containing protein [Pseudomonas eucalypticola]